MQFSHSRLECFESCPFKFQLRYINRIGTIPSDDPASPLILGHALHTGIEQGVEAGVNEYLMAYPVITDSHINEQIKLEWWISRVRAAIPAGEAELMLADSDFIGFIDLIAPVTGFHESPVPGVYDLYDYKYTSNSGSRYQESEQLHLYKYWFEKLNPDLKVAAIYVMWLRDDKSKFVELTPWADEAIDLLIDADQKDEVFDISKAYGNLPMQFASVENEVARLEKQVKELQERQKTLKEGLYSLMEEAGVKSWTGSKVKLTRVLPTTKTSFDSKAFKEAHPDLFKEFSKESTSAGSLRITVID